MEIKLYSPYVLDIEAVMKQNPFSKGKNLKKDHLLFIIHCIMQQRASKDDNYLAKRGKAKGFVPLNSKILQKKIPDYHSCIEYLIELGIIECDGKYLAGKISKGYRLTSPYTGNQFKRVVITDFVLCKKIAADKPFDKKNKTVKQFPYLAEWFNNGKLEIDEQGAIRWINEFESSELKELNNRKLTPKRRLEEKAILFDTVRNYKILVSRFAEKDYYFHKDETGNRLHTNLTNLPKGLRQFITYDGSPLVSVDIKNSQPFMSLPLFKEEFWLSKDQPGKPTLKRISREIYRETGKNKRERNSIIMFRDSSKTLIRLDFQKQEFIKNVANGTFYEYLIDIFEKKEGLQLGKTYDEKRCKVKKMVLTLLFDDDNKSYNKSPNSPSQIFKRVFPTVAKIFGYLKSSDYRNLAIVLQRIESYLLLDRICGRIAEERPSVPILTIHDCLITTVGNEEFVESIMKDELEKSIGKAPRFSVEHWQKSKALEITVAA